MPQTIKEAKVIAQVAHEYNIPFDPGHEVGTRMTGAQVLERIWARVGIHGSPPSWVDEINPSSTYLHWQFEDTTGRNRSLTRPAHAWRTMKLVDEALDILDLAAQGRDISQRSEGCRQRWKDY